MDQKLRLNFITVVLGAIFGCSTSQTSDQNQNLQPTQTFTSYGFSLDRRVNDDFARQFQQLYDRYHSVPSTGFLGMNATENQMISPRFQEGAGFLLRFALIWGDNTLVKNMILAIKAGLRTIDPVTGEVKSVLPSSAPAGSKLSAGDIADAASFYLGDACLGIAALKDHPEVLNANSSTSEINSVVQSLIQGATWLNSQSTTLAAADANAPNRLLYAARAYLSCGVLMSDPMAKSRAFDLSSQFIDQALDLQASSGVFRENGGHDTSYQGVSLSIGFDILVAGSLSEADHARLSAALALGARWLSARVRSDGTIDSSGNTRTCSGSETGLNGKPKVLALESIVRGLSGIGKTSEDSSVVDAAARVFDWWVTHTSANPCF
ncbi:MAG: hypothetical protein AB7G93_10785 [Bdellovibrionales bacterium]